MSDTVVASWEKQGFRFEKLFPGEYVLMMHPDTCQKLRLYDAGHACITDLHTGEYVDVPFDRFLTRTAADYERSPEREVERRRLVDQWEFERVLEDGAQYAIDRLVVRGLQNTIKWWGNGNDKGIEQPEAT